MNGDNDGALDPGETADLTATLKNIGGADLVNISTTIESDDPYITIIDNTGYFGNLNIDEIKENTADPYVVMASPTIPFGHYLTFRLIAIADGNFLDTLYFSFQTARNDYLVWDCDPNSSSGPVINNTLISLGYDGIYTTTLPISDLNLYQAIFVCDGVFPNDYLFMPTSAEVMALINYLDNGGRMYLEGGEAWCPTYGPSCFETAFGINGSGGANDMGPIAGESMTFTAGMEFVYTGENNLMNHIDPQAGTGSFLILHDVDSSYGCGVAWDAGTYRTVGTSFELAGLVDGEGVSTKAVLLDSIMRFFGAYSGIEEQTLKPNTEPKIAELQVCPNPFRSQTEIKLQVPNPKIQTNSKSQTELKIYDASGRIVKDFAIATRNFLLPTQIVWDGTDNLGKDVSAGVYFCQLTTEDLNTTAKIVLMR